MKLALFMMMALMAGGTGQFDPFDQHLLHPRNHQFAADWAKFGKGCPGATFEQQPMSAVWTGVKWSTTRDLAKALKHAESDFFESAELWLAEGKPRIVVLWSLTLDVGSQVRSFVCLNGEGRIDRVWVTNWSFPVDGTQQEWRHELLEDFAADGSLKRKQSYFANAHGVQSAKPTAADGVDGFDFAPDKEAISKLLWELGQSTIKKHGTR